MSYQTDYIAYGIEFAYPMQCTEIVKNQGSLTRDKKSISFWGPRGRGEYVCIDASDVTMIVYHACAQDWTRAWSQAADRRIANTDVTPSRPLQQKTVCRIR